MKIIAISLIWAMGVSPLTVVATPKKTEKLQMALMYLLDI
jgi:hypothetical protein